MANALLPTSQSGVSRHIRELEEELGLALFIRYGFEASARHDRAGQGVAGDRRAYPGDADNIRKLASTFANRDSAGCSSRPPDTQARYAPPG